MEELKVFHACGAVNVETGELTSACLHVLVGRALLFSFPCRSQRCHDISRIGSSQKVIRIVLHAHATHFLSLVSERWVPGSENN